MVAAGYNGATGLTQHLGFPQQPSLLQQPWAAAGLAVASGSGQAGAQSTGARSEHSFRPEESGGLLRRMPPGLEASLATAAEWSSASAWDASAAPSWLILSACGRSSLMQGCEAQTTSAAGTLSPLAQRAADAAVRVAAGLLSPGRWKAPQAVGVASMAALHNSASLPKNFAPYKATYKAMSPAKVPLTRSISNGADEYGRTRKTPASPRNGGTLESSISALADALNSLEDVAAPEKARVQLNFEPLNQGEFLDAHGELVEAKPISPRSLGSASACCTPVSSSLAGADLFREASLSSSISSQSSWPCSLQEAAEPSGEESWLSTGTDFLTPTEAGSDLLAASDAGIESLEGESDVLEDTEAGSEFLAGTEAELDVRLPTSGRSGIVGGAEGGSSAGTGAEGLNSDLPLELMGLGSIDSAAAFSKLHTPLETLPELPWEEDAAASSEAQDADAPGEQRTEQACATPAQCGSAPGIDAEEGDVQGDTNFQMGCTGSVHLHKLPSWAPRRDAPSLATPFAESCAESPFEAPSPRDMQLSPAEEQLVPESSNSAREPSHSPPRSPVLADRAKTEQLPRVKDAVPARQVLHRSRSAGASCAAQAKMPAAGKRLFGIVAQDQSEWQPLVRESSQVMEMVGMDTEWMLNDLLACADVVYA